MKRPTVVRGQSELMQVVQLVQSQQFGVAEKKLRGLLAKSPVNPDAWRLLGDILLARSAYQEAFDAFSQSLACRMSADTLVAMAVAARKTDALDTAENCLRQAIKLNPRHGEAYYRLAMVVDARLGSADEVVQLLQKSIEFGCAVEYAYAMIGDVAQFRMNNRDMARTAYLAALDKAPALLPALMGLAQLYWSNNHVEEAMQLLERAREAGADPSQVYLLLSSSLLKLGKHDECLDAFRRALEFAPDDLHVMSEYLFATNYSESMSDDEWLAEHKRFGDAVNAQTSPFTEYPALTPDPERRLRVGYVSGDLRDHPVAYFFEPVLANHDRERFEVYCYSTHPHCDHVSERLQAMVDVWRNVERLSDEQLAKQIHSDGIDVLVDLSGHTGYHRLEAFAWKPAPVQVTWLGYGATTGMDRMGYVFTDQYFCPDREAERLFVEQVVRLPVYRVFRPDVELEVKPLPALENGYITFASFNNFFKLNNDVLELWADLLNQIPHSRLAVIVNAKESVDYVKQFFAQHQVAEERLLVFTRLNMSHFLQLHWQVDLALDPFPFNGATTSFHGLWMGVPMISMAGSRVMSRSGISLLGPLGLDEFVVKSPEEYIEKAKYWAGNLERLAEIRANLRQRLKQSPLLDEIGFTRNFEAGFRQCWRQWCELQSTDLRVGGGR